MVLGKLSMEGLLGTTVQLKMVSDHTEAQALIDRLSESVVTRKATGPNNFGR